MMQVVAVIPAYNAADTVGSVVLATRRVVHDVVVVDDGSSDGTAEAARAAGASVLRLSHAGKGAALRAAFAHAVEAGASAVVTLDADGQHDPTQIPALLSCWRSTGAHLVIGSRVQSEGEMIPIRRFGNRFSRVAISFFAGVPVPDPQTGFRLYDAKLLRDLKLRGTGYELESEVIVKAARAGFRIESVPVGLLHAEGSSTSHYRPWVDTARICLAVVRSRIRGVFWLALAAHVALLGLFLRIPALTVLILGGYVAFHGAMAWGFMHPRSRLFGPNRSRLETEERVVALTFDDGPHPDVTPRVLGILAAHRAKATFFVIGKWVERHPETLREIVAAGHGVGNHTFRHSYLFWANTPNRILEDVSKAQREIEAVSGRKCRWFRAPVGLKSFFLHTALARLGLELVSWNIRITDRAGEDRERLARRIRKRIAPGSMILLHDGHDRRPPGRPAIVENLPRLLEEIEALGYRCVGLD